MLILNNAKKQLIISQVKMLCLVTFYNKESNA